MPGAEPASDDLAALTDRERQEVASALATLPDVVAKLRSLAEHAPARPDAQAHDRKLTSGTTALPWALCGLFHFPGRSPRRTTRRAWRQRSRVVRRPGVAPRRLRPFPAYHPMAVLSS